MENFSKLYSSEDFVKQILAGLPPKSLMRFNCVCNLWCILIKSPNFIAKHLSNSLRGSSIPILFKHTVFRDNIKEYQEEINNFDDVETLLSSLNHCNEKDDDDDMLSTVVEELNVPLPMKIKHPWSLEIAGHCDGIICLKLFFGNIVLCNPAIKEFKLLPKSCLLLPEEDKYLIYELRYYTEYLGFGYDPKGKDYKVVRIVVYDEHCYLCNAEVYTLGSNSWRKIETNNIEIWFCDQQMFFMGIFYWQICGGPGVFILSFDMGDELFHEIFIPELPDGYKVRLAIWKESIAIFTYQEQIGVPPSYDIWVMMMMMSDVKGSWTKQVTIGPMEGVEMPMFYPLIFWKNDEILMVTNDGRVISSKLAMQTCKYLPIHFVGYFGYTQAVLYLNSIVSIKGGNKLEGIDHSAFYGVETLANGSLRAVYQ